MASAKITLEISGLPEVIQALRRQLAQILRNEADGEPDHVARKLNRIADDFETGIEISMV